MVSMFKWLEIGIQLTINQLMFMFLASGKSNWVGVILLIG